MRTAVARLAGVGEARGRQRFARRRDRPRGRRPRRAAGTGPSRARARRCTGYRGRRAPARERARPPPRRRGRRARRRRTRPPRRRQRLALGPASSAAALDASGRAGSRAGRREPASRRRPRRLAVDVERRAGSEARRRRSLGALDEERAVEPVRPPDAADGDELSTDCHRSVNARSPSARVGRSAPRPGHAERCKLGGGRTACAVLDTRSEQRPVRARLVLVRHADAAGVDDRDAGDRRA